MLTVFPSYELWWLSLIVFGYQLMVSLHILINLAASAQFAWPFHAFVLISIVIWIAQCQNIALLYLHVGIQVCININLNEFISAVWIICFVLLVSVWDCSINHEWLYHFFINLEVLFSCVIFICSFKISDNLGFL